MTMKKTVLTANPSPPCTHNLRAFLVPDGTFGTFAPTRAKKKRKYVKKASKPSDAMCGGAESDFVLNHREIWETQMRMRRATRAVVLW
jgi:hypothetical protein